MTARGKKAIDFHRGEDRARAKDGAEVGRDWKFTYDFENFFHPFVGDLLAKLSTGSLAGFLDPTFHQALAELDKGSFERNYAPLPTETVGFVHSETTDYPPKEIDVGAGPYAGYNWELFFHVPLTIAVHLSKNQRFAEAQRWFHYIFDPTSTEAIPAPQRYWRFLGFRQDHDVHSIDRLLALWSTPESKLDSKQKKLKEALDDGYEAIRNLPFRPHKVASTRPVAYQYYVVMKYLDNLIAWGDSLFMQDTMESINEATQRYVLAANLLGSRPQRVPPKGKARPLTFAKIRNRSHDPMGNVWTDLEGQLPFNGRSPRLRGGGGKDGAPLFGVFQALYFCVPRNDKLLAYWDTVADRLFKIRHCMNIQGVVRPLALFDPEIDPGLLVKAAGAGLDIGSIVSGLNQPIGPIRAPFLIQKALELAGEVRGLGSALLSALEKGDGEYLATLRQGHEIRIHELTRQVRFLQWGHAREATESLLRTRASALERYRYYRRLQGIERDEKDPPDTLAMQRRELTEETFDQAYEQLVKQYDNPVPLDGYPPMELKQDGRLQLHVGEYNELNVHSEQAQDMRIGATEADMTAAVLAALPGFNVKAAFWGVGGESELVSGNMFSNIGRAMSSGLNLMAQMRDRQGQSAAKAASYDLRAHERIFQARVAARELMQIGRQILSSLIAEQTAEREYKNVQEQIKNAQAVSDHLKDKFTREELYGWMQGELSRLYYEYYRFAVDTARRAERTMKQELMRPELDGTTFIQLNHWDAGRKGLLSGEALHLDVKRMEMAYHEHNKRELELTRHVSLRQLDPLALLRLRADGRCEFRIPEWLYDLDCPGHYLRRIKTVSVSLPSVVGPYTSVNCTVSLLRSTVRKSPALLDNQYPRQKNASDSRFVDSIGLVQSIVTSSGTNDAGLFETNLRDERLLPFEGAGAISTWRLELPGKLRPFDYRTITDVVLHIRYTARQGGDQLGERATAAIREALQPEKAGLALLLSLRHDFPTEWAAFRRETQSLTMPVRLRKDHFPYFVQGEELKIDAVEGPDAKSLPRAALDALEIGLNGGNGHAYLSLPADRTADDPFLVVRYSLERESR